MGHMQIAKAYIGTKLPVSIEFNEKGKQITIHPSISTAM